MSGAETRCLLDTSVLLALIRGNDLGSYIQQRYRLAHVKQKPFVCRVSWAELRVLAEMNGWGAKKQKAVVEMMHELVIVDIHHELVQDAYVEIDLACRNHPDGAHHPGKNDLWIAACAKAAGATLLTTDRDFVPLFGSVLHGFYVDPTSKPEKQEELPFD